MIETPYVNECLRLLKKAECPQRVIIHSLKVKDIALELNNKLTHPFQENLIICAALLHDILRTQPHHAYKSGQYLRSLGYERIARIVECHDDLNDFHFDERHVIYLADKFVLNDHVVTLEERYLNKYAQLNDPTAKLCCLKRYQQAKTIYKIYERMCSE